MPQSYRASSLGLTDVGKVRKANEDSHAADDARGFWIVADGMGGHADGQWASSTIVSHVRDAVLTGDLDPDIEALANAVHGASDLIWTQSQERGVRAGSTVVLLAIRGGRFACLWAGDSRAYLSRGGDLVRLTSDHTQVREMVLAGLISEDEAQHHPLSHVLSRAVGAQPDLELDAVTDEIEPGDVFVLCSDGLTGLVSDAEIAAALGAHRMETAGQKLLDMALDRGAPDNVTLVLVRVEETTTLSFLSKAR